MTNYPPRLPTLDGRWVSQGVEKIIFPEEDSWKVDIQQSGGTDPWRWAWRSPSVFLPCHATYGWIRRVMFWWISSDLFRFNVEIDYEEIREGVTIDPTNEEMGSLNCSGDINHGRRCEGISKHNFDSFLHVHLVAAWFCHRPGIASKGIEMG